MLLGTVIAAAFVLQHKEMDGPERRRIFDAAEAARLWAWETSQHLFDIPPPARSRFVQEEMRRCEQALLDAADVAVCKEYHVSPKVYRAILARPDIARQFPHAPEVEIAAVRRPGQSTPVWQQLRTRFSPSMVRLSPKLARRFGYVNPREIEKDKAAVVKPSLMDQLTGPPPAGPPGPSGR